MSSSQQRDGLTFEGPGLYNIVVKGRLETSDSGHLGGMRITTSNLGEGKFVTSLVGWLENQAQLSRVLTRLCELHMPLLSVEAVESEANGDRPD